MSKYLIVSLITAFASIVLGAILFYPWWYELFLNTFKLKFGAVDALLWNLLWLSLLISTVSALIYSRQSYKASQGWGISSIYGFLNIAFLATLLFISL